jgi:hypothetical protein
VESRGWLVTEPDSDAAKAVPQGNAIARSNADSLCVRNFGRIVVLLSLDSCSGPNSKFGAVELSDFRTGALTAASPKHMSALFRVARSCRGQSGFVMHSSEFAGVWCRSCFAIKYCTRTT